MKSILLSASVLLSTVFFSCKGKDSCDLNSSTLVGTYQVTGVSYRASASSPTTDIFSTYSPCEKDDLVIFNSNGTITYSDAGQVCSPDNNDTGSWSLSGSNLNIDGETGVVTSFNCNNMTVAINGATAGELTTISFVKR